MFSGRTGENEVHFELRRWGGEHPMKLLNEMVYFLNLEGSCLIFPFNLVIVDDDIFSDILSYLYLHLHIVIVNLLLRLKLSVFLTIFQILLLFQGYPHLIADNFFYILITTFSSPPFLAKIWLYLKNTISLGYCQVQTALSSCSVLLGIEKWNDQASFILSKVISRYFKSIL